MQRTLDEEKKADEKLIVVSEMLYRVDAASEDVGQPDRKPAKAAPRAELKYGHRSV